MAILHSVGLAIKRSGARSVLHYGSLALRRSGNPAIWRSVGLALGRSVSLALCRSGTIEVVHSGGLARWRSGALSFWHYGTLAGLHSCGLAICRWYDLAVCQSCTLTVWRSTLSERRRAPLVLRRCQGVLSGSRYPSPWPAEGAVTAYGSRGSYGFSGSCEQAGAKRNVWLFRRCGLAALLGGLESG